MNSVNNDALMKYATIRVKDETSKRLFEYIGKRTQEKKERVTADEAINELLDSKGVE
jgi:predicted transcriptional regulator